MNNRKAKITIFILLSLIGLIVAIFFAAYLNLVFSGGNIDDLPAIQPIRVLSGIITDERQRMLTLCVFIIIETGIAAFVLLSHRESFESDTSDITKGIKTPIAIGQGQHGTARWMSAAEKRMTFSRYRLDKRDPIYSDLLRAGRTDAKDVMIHTENREKGAARTLETPVSGEGIKQAPENQQ